MQQVDNPSHLDIARISVPAGAAAAILGFFLLRGPVGFTGAMWIAPVIFPVVSFLLHRRLESARSAQEVARLEARRSAEEIDVQHRIAEMKARERAAR